MTPMSQRDLATAFYVRMSDQAPEARDPVAAVNDTIDVLYRSASTLECGGGGLSTCAEDAGCTSCELLRALGHVLAIAPLFEHFLRLDARRRYVKTVPPVTSLTWLLEEELRWCARGEAVESPFVEHLLADFTHGTSHAPYTEPPVMSLVPMPYVVAALGIVGPHHLKDLELLKRLANLRDCLDSGYTTYVDINA